MTDFCSRPPNGVNSSGGHVQLIMGPMFSGKTTEMLRRLNRYKLAGRVCRIVKYRNDTRYASDKVSTHDRQMQNAISAIQLFSVMDEMNEAHVVAIDEGQFFDDIAECCSQLANSGKIVIVSALDGDFNRKRFKNILNVCPVSEDIIKLNAVCTRCGEDASFTKRLTNDLDLEVIGGQDVYTAMCRDCFFAANADLASPVSLKHGRIEVILGPMFSGKTTEMLRRHNRHSLANRECRVVKYRGDTRYDAEKVVTHDQLMHDGLVASTITEVLDDLADVKVVAIDEGQFFPDVVDCCERLANMGKIVIVAALDGDFNRKEFENKVLDLCPIAEKITKLRAVCTDCGADASFSKRITKQKDQEVIGGLETYRAMCRDCYAGQSERSNAENHAPRPPLYQFNTTARDSESIASKRIKLDTSAVLLPV